MIVFALWLFLALPIQAELALSGNPSISVPVLDVRGMKPEQAAHRLAMASDTALVIAYFGEDAALYQALWKRLTTREQGAYHSKVSHWAQLWMQSAGATKRGRAVRLNSMPIAFSPG